MLVSMISYVITSVFDSLRPQRLRLQLLTIIVMAIDPSPYVDPKILLIALQIIWIIYSRVTFVDYLQENHRLMLRVVKESVESTPAWFKKYKASKE